MPICVIIVWLLASSGLANIDKDMKRKIMIGSVGVMITCSLLVIHLRGSPLKRFFHSNVDDYGVANDMQASPTLTATAEQIHPSPNKKSTHIAYIKTHKTGSSTIWSILINFALNNNLTIALPSRRTGNKLGWPQLFTEADATPPKPDILCHHSRFSRAMLKYMPPDTVYMTSLRDPAEQMHSAYMYFNMERCFDMSFEQFINKPNKTAEFGGKCNSYYKWYLMNGQLYDLGFDTFNLSVIIPEHKRRVLDKIEEIDKQFTMVLVLDKLNESLIVMRDLLNWTTEDIVYLNKNFRFSTLNFHTQKVYTELQKSMVRQWNWADDLIYTHFRKKLVAIIDQNPEYFRKEVENLKYRSELWLTRCVSKVIPVALVDNSQLSAGYEPNMGTYKLTSAGKRSDRCIQHTITEVAKVRLLNSGSPINAEAYKQGKTTTANRT